MSSEMSSELPDNPVVAAFDAAAATYDAWTQVQRDVARALISRAAARGVAPRTILDLGAGTGHATEYALQQWPEADLTAIDAAPAMLARLRAKFPEVITLRRDAASLEGVGAYDLILSSMMAHWLPAPRAALADWRRRLAPSGLLYVATPVAGSLNEWRELTRACGLVDGLWSFPPGNFADGLGAKAEILEFPAIYPDARAFLRALKAAGAHKSPPGAGRAPTRALRNVLAKRSGTFTATFRIAFIGLESSPP
jgi:malonyl-CoA O-methyltransferase